MRNPITLTGTITRQTEKAVLFAQHIDPKDEYKTFGKCWFPKSCIEFSEGTSGSVDTVIVPQWLFDKKKDEQISNFIGKLAA